MGGIRDIVAEASPGIETAEITADEIDCVQRALRALDGRWKIVILSHLHAQNCLRFSELARAIEGVSAKVLSQHLRELERDGIILRVIYAQIPPRVEYSLSAVGKLLKPIFIELIRWAKFRDNAELERELF